MTYDNDKVLTRESRMVGKRSPLDYVCAAFALDRDKIRKHNKEWVTLTKKHSETWPEQGSWDEERIAGMEKVIEKNYKGTKKDKRMATLNYFKLFQPKEREETGPAVISGESNGPTAPPPPPPPYQGCCDGSGVYPVRTSTRNDTHTPPPDRNPPPDTPALGFLPLHRQPPEPSGAEVQVTVGESTESARAIPGPPRPTPRKTPLRPPTPDEGEEVMIGKLAVRMKGVTMQSAHNWLGDESENSEDEWSEEQWDDDSEIALGDRFQRVAAQLRDHLTERGILVGGEPVYMNAQGGENKRQMFQGVPRNRAQTPRQTVAEKEGNFYSGRFCDDLAGWSETVRYEPGWPREGSFNPLRLETARAFIFEGFGDPGWDEWEKEYLKDAFRKWEKYVIREKERRDGAAGGLARGQFPLLFKNNGPPVYNPWGHTDKENLQKKLPPLGEGASKWIEHLEKETAGVRLAIGDVKSLFATLMGGHETDSLFQRAGYGQVKCATSNYDGAPFNSARAHIWTALRQKYPDQPNIGALLAETIGDDESPHDFLERMKRKWRSETGTSHTDARGKGALFFNILKQALPKEVQDELDKTVGIETKDWEEVEQHMVHHIRQLREKGRRQKDNKEKLETKVLQQKLEKKQDKTLPVTAAAPPPPQNAPPQFQQPQYQPQYQPQTQAPQQDGQGGEG